MDDISLVEVPCIPALFPAATEAANELDASAATETGDIRTDDAFEEQWQVSISLLSARLRKQDPVPLLINQIQELEGGTGDNRALFTVLTELYVNALDHGVLELDSTLKSDAEGFSRYFAERERRLECLNHGSVLFDIHGERRGGERRLRIRVEDSGKGFNHSVLSGRSDFNDPTRLHGRGILLLRRLCESVSYHGRGNVAEVVYKLKP